MKRKKILFGMAMATCLLFSCGEQPASSSPSSSKSEESLPAPTPLADSVGELRLHYYRKDGKYRNWAMWVWLDGKEGSEYSFVAQDDYGGIVQIPLSKYGNDIENLNFGYIVKTKGTWDAKDPDGNRFIAPKDLEGGTDKIYNLYLKSGDEAAYEEPPAKVSATAKFHNSSTIIVTTDEDMKEAAIMDGELKIADGVISSDKRSARAELSSPADVSHTYNAAITLENGDKILVKVNPGALYDTEAFKQAYLYDGDLGAIYSEGSTTFKVWSPVSSSIELRIYDNGTPKAVDAVKGSDTYQAVAMTKGEKGVFTATANGDLEGKYYTYFVKNSAHPKGVEVVDPYAKSAGVNGKRGMIVDFSKTNPEGWNEVSPLQIDRKSLTVYETHVADVTSSSTWGGTAANAKKFLGLCEENTKYQGVATGFDHIKELGVNAVQLVPIFDQENDEVNTSFNWGYNPLNYNVLEGSYSSDPYDGYARIREFKKVVAAYHEAGINVIMDVVYNHVNDASGSNFEALVPGYYFRVKSNGSLYNGSGCGNETASDRAMFAKFMKDSTAFWAKEYKLGGFRFDLMALHDIDTMNDLTAKLKAINPYIAVYGEPWNGGESGLSGQYQAKQANIDKFVGFGAFNDKIRDGLIAGGMAGAGDLGWTDGFASDEDVAAIINGLKGGISATQIDPDKNISYVTCHDNYTLYDRYKATGRYTDETEIENMALVAQSAAALSQGTFFMLAGEEFLRTKGGDHNSYKSSYKVNELDYALKVAHPGMMDYYKKLIDLKKSCPGLHLGAAEAKNLKVQADVDNNAIALEFKGQGTEAYKAVIVGPKAEGKTFDFNGYSVYVRSNGSGELTAATPLAASTVLIAKK